MSDDGLPRGLGERLLSLRGFSLLAEVSPSDLAMIARLSRERDYEPGETLAREGESVQSVMLLVHGRGTSSRRGSPVGVLRAFDTVGLLATAAGMAHHLTVVATEAIHALEMDADLVDEVLEDDFSLFVRVLRLGASSIQARRGRAAKGCGVLTGGGERRETTVATADLVAELSGPLAPARKLLVLRDAPLLRMAPVDGLAAFAKRLELVRLPAGQQVEMGGAAETLGLIIGGRAEVTSMVEVSASTAGVASGAVGAVAVTAAAGDMVGAIEALVGNESPLLVRAHTDVHLLRGTASDLLDVIEDHQAMGRRVMAELLRLDG